MLLAWNRQHIWYFQAAQNAPAPAYGSVTQQHRIIPANSQRHGPLGRVHKTATYCFFWGGRGWIIRWAKLLLIELQYDATEQGFQNPCVANMDTGTPFLDPHLQVAVLVGRFAGHEGGLTGKFLGWRRVCHGSPPAAHVALPAAVQASYRQTMLRTSLTASS